MKTYTTTEVECDCGRSTDSINIPYAALFQAIQNNTEIIISCRGCKKPKFTFYPKTTATCPCCGYPKCGHSHPDTSPPKQKAKE